METPFQECARLVTALEDLVAQETLCVSARDFDSVSRIQGRAAPLVDRMAALAPAVTDKNLRARVSSVIERRSRTIATLAKEIEATRGELADLDVRKRRAAKVVPAYGRSLPATHRLSAVG